jgi:GAF domain-containing protein
VNSQDTSPRSADVPVRPGIGDVPVAIAHEEAHAQAASGPPLAPHAQTDEDVLDPGADEDVGAPAEDACGAVLSRIRSLIAGESDEVAIMATIACELHHSDPRFDWTGFYRVTEPGILKIGPYQGGHGCLTIPFSRGVCGKCAREAKTQLVDDVNAVPDHIACSSTTRSEIVVPVLDPHGNVRAVLDIDSDQAAAFNAADVAFLESVCRLLTDANVFPDTLGLH